MTYNSEIYRLTEASGFHEDDQIEIVRIFEVLTEDRRVKILSDWPRIADRIKRNRAQLEEEKRILLDRALERIEEDLVAYNTSFLTAPTDEALSHLKQEV